MMLIPKIIFYHADNSRNLPKCMETGVSLKDDGGKYGYTFYFRPGAGRLCFWVMLYVQAE